MRIDVVIGTVILIPEGQLERRMLEAAMLVIGTGHTARVELRYDREGGSVRMIRVGDVAEAKRAMEVPCNLSP